MPGVVKRQDGRRSVVLEVKNVVEDCGPGCGLLEVFPAASALRFFGGRNLMNLLANVLVWFCLSRCTLSAKRTTTIKNYNYEKLSLLRTTTRQYYNYEELLDRTATLKNYN